MKAIFLLTILLGMLPLAQAKDVTAGKTKSASCAGCHGSQGVSNNPLWPNLAGQQALYLEKQMRAFRDGQREDALMAPMAKGLSDEDIANIAAYFASLKP